MHILAHQHHIFLCSLNELYFFIYRHFFHFEDFVLVDNELIVSQSVDHPVNHSHEVYDERYELRLENLVLVHIPVFKEQAVHH